MKHHSKTSEKCKISRALHDSHEYTHAHMPKVYEEWIGPAARQCFYFYFYLEFFFSPFNISRRFRLALTNWSARVQIEYKMPHLPYLKKMMITKTTMKKKYIYEVASSANDKCCIAIILGLQWTCTCRNRCKCACAVSLNIRSHFFSLIYFLLRTFLYFTSDVNLLMLIIASILTVF